MQLNCHNTIKARSLKNYSKDALFTLLRDTDCSPVFNCAEVDKAWVYFKSLFLVAVDTLAPVKNIRIKVRTEPWINADILKAIKKTNGLFNSSWKCKDENLFMEYKKQRNEVHRLIRKAKVGFFNDKIAENRNDPRKLWKTLKLLGYTKTVKTKSFNLNLDIEGTVISDKLTVANSLNNYFTTIVNTLVKKLPNQAGLYGDNHVQQFICRRESRQTHFP